MLFQDVTVTINLTDITKEEYMKRMITLKAISDNPVSTNTYDEGMLSGAQDLSRGSRKLLDEIIG